MVFLLLHAKIHTSPGKQARGYIINIKYKISICQLALRQLQTVTESVINLTAQVLRFHIVKDWPVSSE